jgi:hypothetical protein
VVGPDRSIPHHNLVIPLIHVILCHYGDSELAVGLLCAKAELPPAAG